MLGWIAQNIGSLLIGALLMLIVCVIIYFIRKDKKAGKSSCGASCAGCPMNGQCHSDQKE